MLCQKSTSVWLYGEFADAVCSGNAPVHVFLRHCISHWLVQAWASGMSSLIFFCDIVYRSARMQRRDCLRARTGSLRRPQQTAPILAPWTGPPALLGAPSSGSLQSQMWPRCWSLWPGWCFARCLHLRAQPTGSKGGAAIWLISWTRCGRHPFASRQDSLVQTTGLLLWLPLHVLLGLLADGRSWLFS